MRRRLDLARLSNHILIVLHEKFFDDAVAFVPFFTIRDALKQYPANAIKLELANLVNANQVTQKTEERTRPSGLIAAMGQAPTIYYAPVDGYQLSKGGIFSVDKFDDDYFTTLQQEIGLAPEAVAKESEWEPIPLTRDDTARHAAVDALDRIVDELRGDNGYAATNPEEKRYVQDKLSGAVKRLRDDTQISWMYLNEFAIRPLAILIKRFGNATIGLAAVAAKEAVLTWLKSKGVNFLNDNF